MPRPASGGSDEEHVEHGGALDQVRGRVQAAPGGRGVRRRDLRTCQANQAAPAPKTASQVVAGRMRRRATSIPAIATPIRTWPASVSNPVGRCQRRATASRPGAVGGDGEHQGGEDAGEPGGAAHLRSPVGGKQAARRPGRAWRAAVRCRDRWPSRRGCRPGPGPARGRLGSTVDGQDACAIRRPTARAATNGAAGCRSAGHSRAASSPYSRTAPGAPLTGLAGQASTPPRPSPSHQTARDQTTDPASASRTAGRQAMPRPSSSWMAAKMAFSTVTW